MTMTFIKKDFIIKELAEEYAYFEAASTHDMHIDHNLKMASHKLELLSELIFVTRRLGIEKEVYDEAVKIYDFTNDDKEESVNKELCEKVYNELLSKRTEKICAAIK